LNDNCGGVTTILLICREGKSRQMYQAEIALPGVSLVCVQSLMEFFCRGVYRPLNGILVDMPTYMRSSEEEKRLMTDLVALFPALRLRCQEATGEIRTLPFGTVSPGNTPPSVFVQEYCASTAPRKIRTSERSQLNMPALLSKSLPVDNVSGARSVTVNISRRGCFLIWFEQWSVGDRCWLVLPGLEDPAPIPVEVCSVQSWGEQHVLPGVGVKFIQLTVVQKVELSRLGGASLLQEDDGLP